MEKLASVLLVVLALGGLACGGDPDYCSELSDLEQSVRDLGEVDLVAGGTNALTDALDTVEANAESTIDAAESDFPEETSAMSESVSSLRDSIEGLGDSPTREEVMPVAADVRAVVTSVQSFADATASECD